MTEGLPCRDFLRVSQSCEAVFLAPDAGVTTCLACVTVVEVASLLIPPKWAWNSRLRHGRVLLAQDLMRRRGDDPRRPKHHIESQKANAPTSQQEYSIDFPQGDVLF